MGLDSSRLEVIHQVVRRCRHLEDDRKSSIDRPKHADRIRSPSSLSNTLLFRSTQEFHPYCMRYPTRDNSKPWTLEPMALRVPDSRCFSLASPIASRCAPLK